MASKRYKKAMDVVDKKKSLSFEIRRLKSCEVSESKIQ
jgi:hypothetical protein